MSNQLTAKQFTIEHQTSHEVQAFDCGNQSWEIEVSDWIKGSSEKDSALSSIQNAARPGRVWIYHLDDGRLVGFGALGYSQWRWPRDQDPRIPLTVITWFAIQKEYQGQPSGPPEQRYSRQVLEHLMTKALGDSETHPIVGLHVHRKNKRAIKFYRSFGFVDGASSYFEKKSGVTYDQMAFVLNQDTLDAMTARHKK